MCATEVKSCLCVCVHFVTECRYSAETKRMARHNHASLVVNLGNVYDDTLSSALNRTQPHSTEKLVLAILVLIHIAMIWLKFPPFNVNGLLVMYNELLNLLLILSVSFLKETGTQRLQVCFRYSFFCSAATRSMCSLCARLATPIIPKRTLEGPFCSIAKTARYSCIDVPGL